MKIKSNIRHEDPTIDSYWDWDKANEAQKAIASSEICPENRTLIGRLWDLGVGSTDEADFLHRDKKISDQEFKMACALTNPFLIDKNKINYPPQLIRAFYLNRPMGNKRSEKY